MNVEGYLETEKNITVKMVQKFIVAANRRLADVKSSVLQRTTPTPRACMYVLYILLLICTKEKTQHGAALCCAALLRELS